MNINGRDITPEKLMEMLDEADRLWANAMYSVIMLDPSSDEIPGSEYSKNKLIDYLMNTFIETEEYEKCAELVKLKK